jgi:predicted outer membrane repeat protein
VRSTEAARPGTLVTNSTFTNNHADNAVGGGAIFALNVVRSIGCTFSGNQSTNGLGGAVFAGANDGAEFDAVNCTFSGNKAAGGGALAGGVVSGTFQLSNVTVSGNMATDTVAHGFGGGGTWGVIQPRNSIVAGPTSAGGAPDCVGNLVSQGYNRLIFP